MDLEEGQRKYGPQFVNNHVVTACHNSELWCLHGPNQFMTAHSAFTYWGDETLRMIDPGVVTPYWDHLVSGVTGYGLRGLRVRGYGVRC